MIKNRKLEFIDLCVKTFFVLDFLEFFMEKLCYQVYKCGKKFDT